MDYTGVLNDIFSRVDSCKLVLQALNSRFDLLTAVILCLLLLQSVVCVLELIKFIFGKSKRYF